MRLPLELVYEGIRYVYDGQRLTNVRGQAPARATLVAIARKLDQADPSDDAGLTDPDLIMFRSYIAEAAGHFERVVRLCKMILVRNPYDAKAATRAGAALRKLGRPQEALEVTARPAGMGNKAAMTVRAAAHTDLGRLGLADKVLRKAYGAAKRSESPTYHIGQVFARHRRIKKQQGKMPSASNGESAVD